MDFPLPDFGAAMEEIVGHAITWLALIDQDDFFSILLVFSIIVAVITFVIQTVKNPPRNF